MTQPHVRSQRIREAVDKIVCPGCGGENEADAVFCANPECHKALGEFRYVLEELGRKAGWHERVADRVTGFIGKPQFLVLHLGWFVTWIVLNTGLFAFIRQFDAYPFALLGIILAAEAVLMTGFLLISQNRQNIYSDARSELDYEVNVRTYREIRRLEHILDDMIARMEALERRTDPREQK